MLILLMLLGRGIPAQAITIDGVFSDWSDSDLVGTDVAGDIGQGDVVDWRAVWAKFENGNLMISYQTQSPIDFANNAWRYEVFLDMDSQATTGYRGPGSDYVFGAEYLIEGGTLYRYAGSGTDWTWNQVGTATYAISGNRLEMQIAGSTIGMTATSRIKLLLVGNNAHTPDFARDDKAGFAYPRDRIVVDGNFADWSGVTPLGTDPTGDVASGDPVDWINVRTLRQNGTLYLSYTTAAPIDLANNGWRYGLLLDTDNNTSTGFVGLPGGIGAEYLIEGRTLPSAPGAILYRYTGTGTTWSWSPVTPLSVGVSGTQLELAIAEQLLGLSGSSYAVRLRLFGNNPTVWDLAPDQTSGFLANEANVAAGELDPTFGSGGKVTTDFFGADDAATGVAIQNDGMIVVVGTTANPQSKTGTDFALARYRRDGTLDTSFGSNGNGKVTTDFFAGDDSIAGVVLQPDGKIVVAGAAVNPQGTTTPDFALARYNSDGSPDTGFGNSGKVAIDFLAGGHSARGVALQADGKIVVAGDGVLARYNANGSLDGSFGASGFVTVSNYGGPRAVLVQPDGKIVVGGSVPNPWVDPGHQYTVTGEAMVVARYNSDGSPDTGFATGGVYTDGAHASLHAIALQSGGEIVAAGDSYEASMGRSRQSIASVRLNKDGGILSNGYTPLFFLNGISVGEKEEVGVAGIAIQPDGDVVTAGSVVAYGWSNYVGGNWINLGPDFALSRYTGNLGLDTSFGSSGVINGGIAVTDFSGQTDAGAAVALQADGRIVVVGTTTNSQGGTGKDFAIARYH